MSIKKFSKLFDIFEIIFKIITILFVIGLSIIIIAATARIIPIIMGLVYSIISCFIFIAIKHMLNTTYKKIGSQKDIYLNFGLNKDNIVDIIVDDVTDYYTSNYYSYQLYCIAWHKIFNFYYGKVCYVSSKTEGYIKIVDNNFNDLYTDKNFNNDFSEVKQIASELSNREYKMIKSKNKLASICGFKNGKELDTVLNDKFEMVLK